MGGGRPAGGGKGVDLGNGEEGGRKDEEKRRKRRRRQWFWHGGEGLCWWFAYDVH